VRRARRLPPARRDRAAAEAAAAVGIARAMDAATEVERAMRRLAEDGRRRRNQVEMEVSMRVDRLALIEKLEAARERAVARAQGRGGGKGLDEARETIDQFTRKWAKAQKERLRMLEAGEARLVHSGGGGAVIARDPGVPDPPEVTNKVYQAMSRVSELRALEDRASRAAAPYDAALELLRMSADETVGVAGTDYQRLLAGEPPERGEPALHAR